MKEGKKEQGFTIVETLIAMSIFSLILTLLVFGVVRMSKSYLKGVNAAATQSAVRLVVDQLSQEIQFGSTNFSSKSYNEADIYCLGSKKYVYKLGVKYDESSPVNYSNLGLTVVDKGDECDLPTQLELQATSAKQLLGDNMRLTELQIYNQADKYALTVGIAFGDTDLLCSMDGEGACNEGNDDIIWGDAVRCKSESGNEYCAVSKLATSVLTRLVQ